MINDVVVDDDGSRRRSPWGALAATVSRAGASGHDGPLGRGNQVSVAIVIDGTASSLYIVNRSAPRSAVWRSMTMADMDVNVRLRVGVS
jgi:hypothetical protein